MRILVHEFVTGGGLADRDVPASLAREGAAMRAALVADLAALPDHEVVTTADDRFPIDAARGVAVVTISSGSEPKIVDDLIATADAVWLVAPETDRCLERLAARVERQNRKLLGPGASAIRRASDKSALPRLLGLHDIPHPRTHVVRPGGDSDVELRHVVRDLRYPIVVKPCRGAGGEGVWLVHNAGELRRAMHAVRAGRKRAPFLLQAYIRGTAASVSILADGRRAMALTVNRQLVHASSCISYRGGATPLEHPLASRAIETALRACSALPGLKGYVGVDLVLTRSDAVVIEVNARLTTSYLGVRSVVDGNVAGMAMAACEGILPAAPAVRRHVRFSADGRVAA